MEDSAESWLPIDGYEGVYSVSSLGRVRREIPGSNTFPGKVKTPITNRYGYLTIQLFRDGKGKRFYVHHLVASAFIGLRKPDLQVHHKDGNPKNNSVRNLEYVTLLANLQFQREVAEKRTNLPTNPQRKFTDKDVLRIRQAAQYLTIDELSRAFKVHPNTIRSVLNGKTYASVK